MTEDLGEVGALVYRELVGVLRTEVRLDGRSFGIADAFSAGDGRAAVQAGEDVCHGPSCSPPETSSRKPRPVEVRHHPVEDDDARLEAGAELRARVVRGDRVVAAELERDRRRPFISGTSGPVDATHRSASRRR
jgi:hypothetical protein